jgi:hypothetical protein
LESSSQSAGFQFPASEKLWKTQHRPDSVTTGMRQAVLNF